MSDLLGLAERLSHSLIDSKIALNQILYEATWHQTIIFRQKCVKLDPF